MTTTETAGVSAGNGRKPVPATTLAPPPYRRRTVHIDPDHWYGVDDLAAHYDLPKSTVRELIYTGVIPATKVGRGWRSYGADILRRDQELRHDAANGPLGGVRAPVIPLPTRTATNGPESV